MKKHNLGLTGITGVLSLSLMAVANASTQEVVELNVLFEVPWCIWKPGEKTNCVAFGSLGNNVKIPLDHCTTLNKSTTCVGVWQKTNNTDGHAFMSSITVTKETYDSGSPTYNLSANMGTLLNSLKPSMGDISLNADGTLTNTVTFYGPKLEISEPDGSLISYSPYLFISPKIPMMPSQL